MVTTSSDLDLKALQSCLVEPPGADAHAMRHRIAERMFGVAASPVRIGRFQLLERLGAGGMGVVSAALDPSLGRKVAVKVLSSDRFGSEGARHLQAEAQTLARLSHPNVVTVYEVGEVDGDVFIVMEYVQGATLRQWQREPRNLVEILEMYRQAASGLAAAHAVGVVHRDFKPSNVLVGVDGRVRVADFGLARATRGEDGVGPTSRSGSDGANPAGTPAYMSPEQAAGRESSELSDQFSFCVALWEAVTGTRPYDPEQLTALGRSPERTIEPQRGERAMPRWLSRVLVRGLRADPARRWPSMEALSTELVDAPNRRRRRTLGGLAGLGLTATTVAMSYGPEPCAAPVSALQGVWDDPTRARIEQVVLQSELPFARTTWASTSRQLDAYVQEWMRAKVDGCMAAQAGGEASKRRGSLVEACLQRRRESLGSVVDLLGQGQPDVVAASSSLAASLPAIDDCTRSQSLELGRDRLDPDRMEAITASLVEVDRVRQLLRVGRPREAERAAEIALAKGLDLHHPPTMSALRLARGLARQAVGDVGGAEADLHEAAIEAESHRQDPVAAEAWRQLLLLAAVDLEDARRAETFAGMARAALKRLGDPAPERAELLDAIGRLEALRGNEEGARRAHEQALELRRELGSDDGSAATSLRLLANSVARSGDHEQALQLYEEAARVVLRTQGPGHPDLGAIDLNVALSLVELGRIDEAVTRAEQGLALRRAVYGPDSLRTLAHEMLLAQIAFAVGDFDRGEALASHAWSVQRRELPRGHTERGMALAILADARLAAGAHEQALADYETLSEEFSVGPNREQLFMVHYNLGRLRCRVGSCDEAEPHFERVLLDTATDSAVALHAELWLARIQIGRNQADMALDRLGAMHARVERHASADPELVAHWRFCQALALQAVGEDLPTAQALAEQAREQFVELELGSMLPELDELLARIRADRADHESDPR